jgi:uncharacterized protein YjaZ
VEKNFYRVRINLKQHAKILIVMNNNTFLEHGLKFKKWFIRKYKYENMSKIGFSLTNGDQKARCLAVKKKLETAIAAF